MIKLNTPKEVHAEMWKDGAIWTGWDKGNYIKFNADGKCICEKGNIENLHDYNLTNNDDHFWTPYIPPKKEPMTDDEMLAIIAKKPWIKRINKDLAFKSYALDIATKKVHYDNDIEGGEIKLKYYLYSRTQNE